MTTYSAVVTTGIYCRPGCSARPLARNVLTFDHPAAAEAAGFRACHRCRPYRVAAPLPATAPELVCEAVQQIISGALDDGGTEASLADRIGLRNRRHRADRLAADGGLTLRLPVLAGYDWDQMRGFLALRLLPGVEAIEERTYRRTISVAGAPGLLEISPGVAGEYLLLRAHLPYWEG